MIWVMLGMGNFCVEFFVRDFFWWEFFGGIFLKFFLIYRKFFENKKSIGGYDFEIFTKKKKYIRI